MAFDGRCRRGERTPGLTCHRRTRARPFAWSGIFVIWIPFVAFIIQFGANTAMLLKAIRSEAEPVWDAAEARAVSGIDSTLSPVL